MAVIIQSQVPTPFSRLRSAPQSTVFRPHSMSKAAPAAPTWGRAAYAYDRQFADPKVLLGVMPSPNSPTSTSPRTSNGFRTSMNVPASNSANITRTWTPPATALSVDPRAFTKRSTVSIPGTATSLIRPVPLSESSTTGVLKCPVSPRTSLREVSRRQDRQDPRRAASESNQLNSLVTVCNNTKLVDNQANALEFAFTLDLDSLQPQLIARSSASKLASTPASASLMGISSVEDEMPLMASSVASASPDSSTSRKTTELNPSVTVLVLHLLVASAFLTARDEMAIVEKKRSLVELAHGETRAFVW